MSPLAASLIAGGVQSGLIVLLAADKWVHKLTGDTPLEAQIRELRKLSDDLKKLIEESNARSSKKASELTVYLDQRREAFDVLSTRVAHMEGELRARADSRADNYEDRRGERR